jgi:hypothetical protein
MERTSGLEDILVQHMPCNRSDSHPRSLQYVREHGLRGDCEQDHVLCDRRREFRMVLVAIREAAWDDFVFLQSWREEVMELLPVLIVRTMKMLEYSTE